MTDRLFYFIRAYYYLVDGYTLILKELSDLLYFFNLEVLIESRASNSTSKAIFYTIIKKKKATENLFGVCQDLSR